MIKMRTSKIRKEKEDHPQFRYEIAGVCHSTECPHKQDTRSVDYIDDSIREPRETCTEYCLTEYDERSYEGATLCMRERNYYHDSDFYAVVWDEVEQETKYIEYATTRGWTYANGARVDATDEIKAKAAEYQYVRYLEQLQKANQRQSREIATDRRVKVIKGRKVLIGTEGTVKWTGMGNYRNMRARIETDKGEEHWIDCSNLEIIEPEQWLRPEATVKQAARRLSTKWHYLYLPDNLLVV